MITKDELASLIDAKVQDHKSDRDGGYGLVDAISHLRASLDSEDQAQLREYLLEKVEQRDPGLWGIALEVLTRHGNEDVGKRLEGLVRAGRHRQVERDLIMALLRMGHPALEIYLPHIQSLIVHQKPVCAELAHLYRVSPDSSIKLSASFLAKELSSKDGVGRVENCMSVFLYNYPLLDEQSLARLVAETREIDARAAEELRRIIVEYLGKPWVVKYVGPEKKNRVLAHMTAGYI